MVGKVAAGNAVVEKISNLTRKTVNTKIVIANALMPIALNLTKATVDGAVDIKLAAIDASSNFAKAVVRTKASVFGAFLNHLKSKMNIVLCKFRVKCQSMVKNNQFGNTQLCVGALCNQNN